MLAVSEDTSDSNNEKISDDVDSNATIDYTLPTEEDTDDEGNMSTISHPKHLLIMIMHCFNHEMCF